MRRRCGRSGRRERRIARFEQLEFRHLLSGAAPSVTDASLPLSIASQLAPASAAASSNQAITADPGVQQMPSVAVDPHNSNHVVIAYMDYSLLHTGYAGIGVSVSTDGGGHWQSTSVPLPSDFDQGAADPIVRFDDQGHVFISYMAATFLGGIPPLTNPNGHEPRALGFQSNNGIFVSRSDDGGVDWQPAVSVASHLYDGTNPVPFEIIPDLGIDTHRYLPDGKTLNANYGNLYAVWSRYYASGQFPGEPDSTGGSQIMISVSKDGGQSWQLQLEERPNGIDETVIEDAFDSGIGPPAGLGAVNWSHVSVGPAGDVYVSLFFLSQYAFYYSADGGKSFTAPDTTTGQREPFGNLATAPDPTLPYNDQFRLQSVEAIATDPARPGTVYAAEYRPRSDSTGNATDPEDIIFARSTDYGATWQTTFQLAGIQATLINDDNDGQNATGGPDDVVSGQAMPCLATDAQGDLALIWYDTRRDPKNHLLDVFATVSSDGGKTFSPNFRITDVSFDPNAGAFVDATGNQDFYLGDAIGLALANDTLYATWTDTRQGNQDIFFRRLALDPVPAPPNDRFENNNTASTATDLGPVIHQHLAKLSIPVGDEDWFRVTTTATGNLNVSALQESSSAVPRLELYDASGTTLLVQGTAVLRDNGQAIGQQISFASSANETFLVRVLPASDAVAEATSRYTLDIESLTANLGTLEFGSETSTFTVPGDASQYLVTAAAAGVVQAIVTPSPGFQGNLQLQILDPNTLALLASGNGAGSANISVAIAPVEQGQTILVRVFGDATALGMFTLDMTNLDRFNSADNKSHFIPDGQGPSEVAIADLNHDNIPDLVVSDTLANVVSVLLGNGDGTFQAPRQYTVGAFKSTAAAISQQTPSLGRAVAVTDVNRDGIPDIIVTNDASSDVSVLLGNGDGTFQPQRRFDATPNPFAMAVGDLNGDHIPDLAVIDDAGEDRGKVAILLGRGDGTFQPPLLFDSPLSSNIPSRVNIKIADLNGDGHNDLVITSDFDPHTHVLLGNGDGTFQASRDFNSVGPGLAIADLNGDGKPDLIETQYASGTVGYALGNGDGTFQHQQVFKSGEAPVAVAVVADYNGDGLPDLIVANSGVNQPTQFGPPTVVLLHGFLDKGNLTFVNPQVLATGVAPQDLQVADLNGDGIPDVVVVDRYGLLVIFGKQPTITQGTSRDLATAVHLVQPTLTITPSNQDAWYRLQVPTEVVSGAKDQVLDFSAGFASQEGAGLGMAVVDPNGNVRGSGERFRVVAHQGETLYVHIFGKKDLTGVGGAGAYTLDIDTLPQVAAVEAQNLLPGQGTQPGGPTTCLVLVFQGDRLDADLAMDPKNYAVIWAGPDGLFGTQDDQQIAIGDGLPSGSQTVVYDPSSNLDVASGLTYPTAIRQTVTLLFGTPLPAGNYRITVSANVVSADFSLDEQNLLSSRDGFTGHPVVSVSQASVQEGATLTEQDLVQPSSALGDLDVFEGGTRFLTQFHNDLGALLDVQLTASGSGSTATQQLLNQILARFGPALGPAEQRLVSLLVIFLDPASFLLDDPNGRSFSYDLQKNSVASNLPQTFIEVGGNVEVIVIPNPIGTFHMHLADVAASARRSRFLRQFGRSGRRHRLIDNRGD